MRNPQVAEETNNALTEAKAVRRQLKPVPVLYLGNRAEGPKDYVGNFGAMILSRSLDNFDDAIFLIEARRYPAACAIARGLIETVAFGYYTLKKAREELASGGGDAATQLVIKHTNSSFFKQKEQDALKKGLFKLEDYEFTEAAKERMLAEAAATIRVGKALELLFKDEKRQKGAQESTLEMMYNGLCEWTHPSQMSLFTYYAEGGELTTTSIGPVHVKQAAKFQCAQGLKIIQWLPALMNDYAALSKDVLAAGG